jgi:hypothetical protein
VRIVRISPIDSAVIQKIAATTRKIKLATPALQAAEKLASLKGTYIAAGCRGLKEKWLEPLLRRNLHEVLVRGASAKDAEGKSVSARRARL